MVDNPRDDRDLYDGDFHPGTQPGAAGQGGGLGEDGGRHGDRPAESADQGRRPWRKALAVAGVVLAAAFAVFVASAFGSGDDEPAAVTSADETSAEGTAAEEASVEETDDAAVTDGSGTLARPAVDEPATITLAGEDACGNLAAMQDAGIDLAAGPGQQGGRVRLLGRSPGSLTGVLQPGGDGVTWEDLSTLEGGVADEQLFEDVIVGDGMISGALSWTNHDGCTATFDASIAVPTAVSDWFGGLPPAGPSDCRFTGSLSAVPENLVLTGVLTDAAGASVANEELTIEVFGHEAGLDTYTAVSDAEGKIRVEVASPPGDPSSISALVVKGAHSLASLFIE